MIDPDFYGKALHKLKSPLTVIREGIAIVLDETAGPVNDEQKKFLETAKSNVSRLARMMDSLMMYKQLISGDVSFSFCSVEISEILKSIVSDNSEIIDKRQLNVCLVNKSKSLCICDKKYLSKAINYIFENVCQYSKPASEITVLLDEKEQNHVLEIVSDNNHIESDCLDDMFEPFVRFQSGDDYFLGGSGIGLSIAKYIIGMNKGHLSFRNIDDRKSKYIISFPIDMSKIR